MSVPLEMDFYLEKNKINEIAQEMVDKGYRVELGYRLKGYSFDLMAEKDNEKIFFEVKSGNALSRNREILKQMASAVQEIKNATFKLVVVNPPRQKNIIIKDLEDILFQCFLNELPAELNAISSHTKISDISDAEVLDVEINKEDIRVSGEGLVTVSLQYGADGEQEDEELIHDTFPFKFQILLNHQLELIECSKIEVDVSSFYQ
ncbi:MAG: hypothetical protein ACUVSK_02685 [Desulfotomaculales bacterium]